MAKLQIIELTPAYVPLVLEVELQSHTSPWSQKILESSFNGRSHNFALIQDDQILGYYFAQYVAGEMTLENICITPQKQGKGLARKLMTHLVEHTKKLKGDEIWLEVRKSNIPAINLYQSFDFNVTGERKEYYPIPNSTERETALLMKKSLL